MGLDHLPKIHSVELVSGENQNKVGRLRQASDVPEIFSNRISGSFIPVGPGIRCLLGCQHLDETASELIKRVSTANMLMQTCGHELGNDKNSIDTTVDAIRNRDINQAILPREWHRRLGANPGQRRQSRSSTSSKHKRNNTRHQSLSFRFFPVANSINSARPACVVHNFVT